MDQVLTVNCRIIIPFWLRPSIDATVSAFVDACNFVREIAQESGVRNKLTLQHLAYQAIRTRFKLPANLAIRAIARVAQSMKAGHRNTRFRSLSVDLDRRVFRLRERDWTVRLTLVGGSHRFNLDIGDFQKRSLTGRAPTFAHLVANKNGECFLKFTIRHQVPASSASEQVLGVDLGIRNLASLSTGERFGGTETDGLRRRFQKVRSSLQRKGTKGAKRVLKRLSGREKRYMAWVNHTISARIVRYARHHEMAVAMEDLTGIRTRARLGKCQRKALHRWAFRQIRSFIMYKSLLAGVALILVNPAFTSQTCHRCHHIGTRQADSFRCGHCGYKGHADYNGAKNIALLGACVTRPEHSLVCPLMGR